MQHTSPGTPASPFLFLAACFTIQRKRPSQTPKKKTHKQILNSSSRIVHVLFPAACFLFSGHKASLKTHT